MLAVAFSASCVAGQYRLSCQADASVARSWCLVGEFRVDGRRDCETRVGV